jgi:hypothetical protein
MSHHHANIMKLDTEGRPQLVRCATRWDDDSKFYSVDEWIAVLRLQLQPGETVYITKYFQQEDHTGYRSATSKQVAQFSYGQ